MPHTAEHTQITTTESWDYDPALPGWRCTCTWETQPWLVVQASTVIAGYGPGFPPLRRMQAVRAHLWAVYAARTRPERTP